MASSSVSDFKIFSIFSSCRSNLPNIFKRFYKADNARTVRTNSSGLGLSIVNNIVQNHDGKIKIESTVGKGTIVTISFSKIL